MNIQIDSLPNIAIYYPQKEVFSNIIGGFDFESISHFMDIFVQGKTSINSLKLNDINLRNVKCEEIVESKSVSGNEN